MTKDADNEDDKDTPQETVRPLQTSSEQRAHAPPPPSAGVLGNYVRELRAEQKPTKALLARLELNGKAVLKLLLARKPSPRLIWWLVGAVLVMALLNLIAALAHQLRR